MDKSKDLQAAPKAPKAHKRKAASNAEMKMQEYLDVTGIIDITIVGTRLEYDELVFAEPDDIVMIKVVCKGLGEYRTVSVENKNRNFQKMILDSIIG